MATDGNAHPGATARWLALLALATSMSAGACVGEIGDRPGDGLPPWASTGPGGGPGAFGVGAGALRRLTRVEYEATLRDLFGSEAVDSASLALAGLPTDRGESPFSSMSLGVTTNHVDGWFKVADAIGAWLIADPARLAALEPCLGSSPDDACVQGFVSRFGRRVFRRPLTEAESAALWSTYTEGAALGQGDGLQLLVLGLLQAPPFLYRVETAGAPAETPDTYRLDGFELATRLSYFVWGTTPDEELLDAAESGALDEDAGLATQLERLWAHPRAAASTRWFFAEWLDLDQIPTPQQSPEFLDGIAPATLSADMRAELEAYFAHQVAGDGSFAGLMTSTVSFLGSEALADVYGVDAPADAGTPVDLPAGQRDGLLTRAGVLAGPGESTHPVRRGAFVRRKLLCDTIPPPDPKDFPPNSIVPPPFDASKTARERWTAQTSAALCAGCHVRINPLGFALENYDAIGRWRDLEPVLDPDTGDIVSELSIDAKVVVELDPGSPVEVAGAKGLGEALAASPAAQDCFARQYLRFAQGRMEMDEDEVLLEHLATTLADGGLRSMMQAIALSPAFRQNRIQP